MTALAAERNTPEMGVAGQDIAFRNFPMTASVKIWKGALVVLDASGDAKPGVTALSLTAVGRAEQTQDNTSGGAGALTVNVQPGVFKFANLGTDLVAQANVGTNCFITDDQTVSATSATNTKSVAGRVIQVDSDGVWVAVGLSAIFGT